VWRRFHRAIAMAQFSHRHALFLILVNAHANLASWEHSQ
jgi:hypothetical protein